MQHPEGSCWPWPAAVGAQAPHPSSGQCSWKPCWLWTQPSRTVLAHILTQNGTGLYSVAAAILAALQYCWEHLLEVLRRFLILTAVQRWLVPSTPQAIRPEWFHSPPDPELVLWLQEEEQADCSPAMVCYWRDTFSLLTGSSGVPISTSTSAILISEYSLSIVYLYHLLFLPSLTFRTPVCLIFVIWGDFSPLLPPTCHFLRLPTDALKIFPVLSAFIVFSW